MRTRRTLILAAALVVASCSSDREEADAPEIAFANEPAASGEYWSRGESTAAPDVDAFDGHAPNRMVVSPDRALVRVDARVAAPTPTAVTARVRMAAGRLVEGLSEPGVCAATVADYGVPARTGDVWRARASLRLDVAMVGTNDVGERLSRLERCMRRFETLGPELRGVELAVSDPLVTIDEPGQHRAALLTRALAPLHEVAALTGTPAAFEGSGLRCTSRGQVSIVGRALSGVAVEVDLDCRPRTAAPETAAET